MSFTTESNGAAIPLQEYRTDFDTIVPFVRQMLKASNVTAQVGTADTTLQYQDGQSTVSLHYDVAAIKAALATIIVVTPVTISFEVPPVLTGFTVVLNENTGNGTGTISGVGTAVGTSASVAMSPRIEGSGSCSIMPDVQIETQDLSLRDVFAKEVAMFVDDGTTLEQMLAKITTKLVTTGTTVTFTSSTDVVNWNSHPFVNGDTVMFTNTGGTIAAPLAVSTLYYIVSVAANTFKLALTVGGTAINITTNGTGTTTAYCAVRPWPVFLPVAHTVTVSGQSATLTATASISQNVHIDGPDISLVYSEGTGQSHQISTTTKTLRIPPTLHGQVTLYITGTSPSVTRTVTASAHVAISSGTNWPARDANTGSLTLDLSAAVAPNIFSPTSPAAAPISGLSLYSLDSGHFEYGMTKMRAVVFDWSTI